MALIAAVENNHRPIVTYLVEHSASVHALDNEALRIATSYGHIDIVQYLGQMIN